MKNDLLKLLEDIKVRREVGLISDGKAKIEIKGTGHVMPTTNKTIFLLPGSYKFVAKCKGHRDNQKKVNILLDNKKKIIVRIGCGEQI